ncbi:hypothetical protein E5676_scaffold216G00450 [Cucumis melo var. makuwa]|uniref:Uncharacterized protein n=1 Tax=Cucumis melo var. makuwa TaxID=1194695 RepID=A0A5D3E2E9_CUCMM|nr:hypothetical protein E5676_scaffold216G00450 [Cucumis melo var. makuwa]
MLETLKKTIEFFEWSSGQKINWGKSALGGLPLGGYSKQAVFWKPVIDKIQGKLEKMGLGLGGIENRNLALLAKWGWIFFNEEKSLWVQIMKSIHGESQFNWDTKGSNACSLSSPWISISKSWNKVDSLPLFKIGSGMRKAFWYDPWADLIPRRTLFQGCVDSL